MSIARDKEAFLTTFYDPLYPNLHQAIFKSRLLLSTSTPPDRYVSWFSLFDLLREQGLRACAAQTRDNLYITFTDLQTFIWARWGSDPAYENLVWPPT